MGETTRPFRYDLNQIPYDYTVEVKGIRFKGFDLIDRVPEELWMEVCDIVQQAEIKTISKKKECKSKRSRDIWSKRQVWPWSTKWSRAKANRFCQENTLVIANTLFQQEKRRLYTWTSPDGQQQNQIGYILCSWTWRSSIQLAETRPRADCGSDHELLTVKFRLKLKNIRKTTR